MFRRLWNLIRGMFGLGVTGLERRNPEALLELERENLRTQIAQYNDGLASHAGMCERLMSQVKRLEAEERELRARTTANLRAGNRDAAGQLAMRLQTISSQLEENRAQLKQAEDTYKNLVSARDTAVNAARQKIESLRHSLDDLKVKNAMAELTEMASGMVTKIGGAGDTLDRLHQMVEEDRSKAAGRVRVAQDTLDLGDIQMKEAEQKALAEQALADFAAKEGIALPPTPGGAETTTAGAGPTAEAEGAGRSMGPGVTG